MTTTYWRTVLAVVPIVGAVVATVFFLLRLYSRLLLKKNLDTGDILMSLGLFISYGVTICTMLAAFSGVGNDIWGLQLKYHGRVIMLFWLTQTFWALSQIFIKLSVTLLLRSLLASVRKWEITTTALFIYTIAWGIAAILVNIFQCWPPQHFWLPTSTHGACINGQTAFFMSIGALSLIQDVVLLLLPVAVVWRLRLPIRQKVQITVAFSIGGLVCVFSLLRLVAFKNYIKNNATSSGSKEALWTLLELNLAFSFI
ncbi:hypothetical protein N7499_005457 [Penicillium canescens]|uniref:uncharacterized protein n=1 Tax=Penicillium canescens TaxID=5083 RepID=UPI0026DF0DE0|nr:uncharacterized protein N7446_001223 [Penicillium canescens]KAJ5998164.1 hypothetical protein N7522_009824 [Penicillium canescens]KAJ6054503.1 hypothetical protein N7444_003601 [Penicillium canescens]KAJ6073446.1 hypothetical protein N7446_001223 [Penicillium canescens]KAJ6080583.1 hypothetical protein N7499_005457 [Penicillium canescens]